MQIPIPNEAVLLFLVGCYSMVILWLAPNDNRGAYRFLSKAYIAVPIVCVIAYWTGWVSVFGATISAVIPPLGFLGTIAHDAMTKKVEPPAAPPPAPPPQDTRDLDQKIEELLKANKR